MPSQKNIKLIASLLNSLSELEAYLTVLVKMQESEGKEGSLVVSAGSVKYTYDLKDLKESDILSSLIENGNKEKTRIIENINTLLNSDGKDSGLAEERG
jgi:hypothetical protein